MKKTLDVIFIGLCAVICLVPLVGMFIVPTNSTTEKRSLATWPSFVEEGEFNSDYLSDMGKYFEDHFALKNQLVAVDAQMMTTVFQTSSVATVVKGTDEWLYYSSSLNDYLGRDVLSKQEVYNLVHNIRLLQDNAKEAGAEFVFTIAPNKNSLYPDNMPYYYKKVSDVSNYNLVKNEIIKQEIEYVDLFEAFQNDSEVLYRKQDSHWNNKGAVLAYNKILEKLDKPHMDYSDIEITRSKSEIGDLANALYSVSAKPDWDYKYNYEPKFSFTTDTESWEEDWICTSNEEKMGQLLMYRDSFGNTLSPLLADEFKEANFSKETVYFWDEHLQDLKSKYIIVEIVERNLNHFLNNPPIMEGPVVEALADGFVCEEINTDLEISESMYDSNYCTISGKIDDKDIDGLKNVYVEVDGKIYNAYLTSDNGFLLYLKNNSFSDNASVKVLIQKGTD